MVNYFEGGSASLGADGSGSIRIRASVDGEVTQILVNGTGRCEITDIDISGYEDIFDGVVELVQLQREGSVYDLPETIPISKGTDVVFSLTDISGAANDVYIALRLVKA